MSRCPNPSCGSDRAYIGLSVVECPDAGCRHFSPKLAAELQPRQVVVVGAPLIGTPSRPVTISNLWDDDLQDAIRDALQPPHDLRSPTPYPTMTPTLPQEGPLFHLTPDGVDGKIWRDKSGHGNDFYFNKDVEAAWAWDRALTAAEHRQVDSYIQQRYGIQFAGPEHPVEDVDPKDPLAPWKPAYGTALNPEYQSLYEKVFDADGAHRWDVKATCAPFTFTVTVKVVLPPTVDFIPLSISFDTPKAE